MAYPFDSALRRVDADNTRLRPDQDEVLLPAEHGGGRARFLGYLTDVPDHARVWAPERRQIVILASRLIPVPPQDSPAAATAAELAVLRAAALGNVYRSDTDKDWNLTTGWVRCDATVAALSGRGLLVLVPSERSERMRFSRRLWTLTTLGRRTADPTWQSEPEAS